MAQREIFLQSEGDAWFLRNQQNIKKRNLPDDDMLLQELCLLPTSNLKQIKILEIGCGEGSRLAWIKNNLNAECYGIEPSIKAVNEAIEKGIKVKQGTADVLPFENGMFNIIIFGFCLYLCDREDLFRIADEANRVLSSEGWVIIQDFFSEQPTTNDYHHYHGIKSFKMDYRTLFTWHPNYTCITHKIRHHLDCTYTDFMNEWTAVSILRKYQR
jgi:ubiquinone/menaquinone biosynthesis C-methylase UbiE